MISFTPEESQKMERDLIEMNRKAKIGSAKVAILRVGIGTMTGIVLADHYRVVNEWYWIFLILLASIAAWDVISTIIANIMVAISTQVNKNK